MLLFEPTPTYSFDPSGLAVSDLVQWWSMGPPGSSAMIVPSLLSILVAPS